MTYIQDDGRRDCRGHSLREGCVFLCRPPLLERLGWCRQVLGGGEPDASASREGGVEGAQTKRMEIAMPMQAKETQGLSRSPTRANFQNSPRKLQGVGSTGAGGLRRGVGHASPVHCKRGHRLRGSPPRVPPGTGRNVNPPIRSKSTRKTYPVFWFKTLGAVAMKRREWGVSRSPGGCEGIYLSCGHAEGTRRQVGSPRTFGLDVSAGAHRQQEDDAKRPKVKQSRHGCCS